MTIVINDAIENALLSALIGLFFSGLAFYIGRNRVKNAILGMINAYILDFLAKTKQHPEIMAEILMPIINEVVKGFKGGKVQGFSPESLAGGGLQALIPMLPRKWQGPAAIASFFLGKQKKDENQTSSGNPWG